MRTEKDILGERHLPEDSLYGINTLRASENFDLKQNKVNINIIHSIVKVKKAAAITYKRLNVKPDIYDAVIKACDDVLQGGYDDQFITQALQGGAGTSTNMNVNEVLANLALKIMGRSCGEYNIIHPLDDVNRGQSTNDVYPTALRIAAIEQLRLLSDECAKLQESFQKREAEYGSVKKLGRTELMDAVPITVGEELGAYAQCIARDRWRLYKIEERLRQVNIGGTAVGIYSNASRKYRFNIIEELRKITGIGLASAEYPMDITQNNDVFVEVSGLIKSLAVNLMKIANDFRLMNSGPYGGFGEIRLKAVQQGSTIMPGKINPVIPEMVIQCAIKVIANDTSITVAASHGEFELNAFLPLIADSLLESLQLMKESVYLFRQKCVEVFTVSKANCSRHLQKSFAFGADYIQKLGYDTVGKIIKENSPEKAKEILDSMTDKTETLN